MAAKMHAVCYDSFGGGSAGLKHIELPVPSPGEGEVLLKVEAASLNAADWKAQEGALRPMFPRNFPYVPGTDIAGEVVELGPDVKTLKVGDKVVAFLYILDGGGLAEYAVTKENLTIKRPPEVSAAEAACLPNTAVAAYQAVTQSAGVDIVDGSSEPQKNILVTAASGGVGHFAVQLAKLGNAHVTATCGGRNIDFVKSLEADEAIDYMTPEGAALLSPSGKKYDAVINCTMGDIPWSIFEPNLAARGKVVDLTPTPGAFFTYLWKRLTLARKILVPFGMRLKSEDLEVLVHLVKEGKLKSVIDSKYPLSKAEDAWAKIMSCHATGKVIVEIGS